MSGPNRDADSSLNIDTAGSRGTAAPAAASATDVDALPAGAATATLTLTPPGAVARVAPAQAAGAVELDPAQTAALDHMIARFLEAITSLDVHDEAFASKVRDIQKLGDEDVKASAAVANRLLDKPMAAMANGGVSEASEVSKSLLSLRRTVEELDPAKQGDLFSPR